MTWECSSAGASTSIETKGSSYICRIHNDKYSVPNARHMQTNAHVVEVQEGPNSRNKPHETLQAVTLRIHSLSAKVQETNRTEAGGRIRNKSSMESIWSPTATFSHEPSWGSRNSTVERQRPRHRDTLV